MKSEQEIMNSVRAAINDCTKGIDELPSLRYRIAQKAKGEKPVVKKISGAMVLAIVLTLVFTSIAIAATINWYLAAETVAYQEVESGYFDQWDISRKEEFLQQLIEAGLIENNVSVSNALKLQDDGAITRIITNWLGLPEDAVSFVSVTERVLGPFSTWSLEDKAWYSSVMLSSERLGDEAVHLLPTDTDLSQQQALQIAEQSLIDHGLTTQMTLDSCIVDYDFIETPDGQRLWVLGFRLPLVDDPSGYSPIESFMIAINPDGEVISDNYTGIPLPWNNDDTYPISQNEGINGFHSTDEIRAVKGEEDHWTLEERAYFISWYGLPNEDDIDEQSAIRIAKETIATKYPSIMLDHYRIVPFFVIDNDIIRDDGIYDTYWRIDFYVSEDNHSGFTVIIDSQSGEVVSISNNAGGNG